MRRILFAFVMLCIQSLILGCETPQVRTPSETTPSKSTSLSPDFQLHCESFFQAIDIIESKYIEQCEENKLVFHAVEGMKAEVIAMGCEPGKQGPGYEHDENQRRLFAEVYRFYLDNTNISAEELFNSALKNVTRNLDPHSLFLSRAEYEELRASMSGSFSAIGVELTMRGNSLTVCSTIEGSPAEKSGIRSGDSILQIDDKTTTDMRLVQAVRMLRGPKGSSVRLVVRRQGLQDPLEYKVNRDTVKYVNIQHRMVSSDIGYARLRNFPAKTSRNLSSVLQKIDHQVKGLILDLRNNSGGLLSEGIEVADLFLDSGVIVRVYAKSETDGRFSSAGDQDGRRSYPMVVLVNRATAGAAEIVAGALKDNKRALILGDRTTGWGRIQTIYPLANGSAIKLTTHEYLTPSGLSFLGGLEPDVIFDEEGAKVDLVYISRIALEQVRGMPPESALYEMMKNPVFLGFERNQKRLVK